MAIELIATGDAFNYDAATIFMVKAAVGQEIIFTAEDSGNETGIYYFKAVDGSGKISEGDQIFLLAVVGAQLADGDFIYI